MPFETLVQIFAALFGLVVGSFLNVVIYRIPLIYGYGDEGAEEDTAGFWRALVRDYRMLFAGNAAGVSLAKPDSRCPACGTKLRWYWNIPVVSWLALRGRCAACKAPISARYPAVELLTGVLAWALVARFGPSPWALYQFLLVAALVAITFIDLDHMLIPDVISVPGIAVGLLGQLVVPEGDPVLALAAMLAGGGSFWLIAVVFQKLRGVEGMGGGDIKLLAMIGAFSTPFGVLQTVLVGSIVGSVVGVGYLVATRRGGETRIPFGPFLAFGGVTAALYPTLLADLLLAGVPGP